MSINKLVQTPQVQTDVIQRGRDKSSLLNSLDKGGFEKTLKGLQQSSVVPTAQKSLQLDPLKFSNHAIQRMQQRGLHFNSEELQKIEMAVGKAREKGAQETLVLSDKAAMVVSVKNNTVVTVVDKESMKENVFTKIDSTVMI
ncbi:MAG: hypothetical protein KDD61_05150 [Bdellovibrionales bacterium]|nr:hypothetical protein [Bdellovibrionales bacterium]